MATITKNLGGGFTYKGSQGAHTVSSTDHAAKVSRPECHAPSTVRVNDLSDKADKSGTSPRAKARARILAFWESQGWAMVDEAGQWVARDVVNGGTKWLPLSEQGEDTRHDVIVFSHVIPAEWSGAWCACNVVPETGNTNHLRGAARPTLTLAGESGIRQWGRFWATRYARSASLARLSPNVVRALTAA